jgi:GT2 family glycosyltransferase
VTSFDSPIFSIIVPTRGRPGNLRRLLDSFKVNTSYPGTVEIILVIDADDAETVGFIYDELSVKKIVVSPGLTMGSLNSAGYESSSGQYLMLLNDDVIVRTRGWDEKVLAAFRMYGDEIVLVHVNDKIFEQKLCTFPFLSKKYCELAGGICPVDYVRYRIDDHIYNVFNLLAVLGKVRILYLPNVVFEHANFVLNDSNLAEYRPNERIHGIDTKRFNQLLPERKALALRLMDHIDRRSASDVSRVRQSLLNQVTDSVALRRPEYVKLWTDNKILSTENTRVTVGVVSANLKSDHARTCIDLIKKFTSNFDLVILDNNRKSTFNHPHEMNKLLSICDTDFLVLLDDDVFVEPGWLDGMLRCVKPSVGVVTPLHKDALGNLSYAGVVMRPDCSGHHSHCLLAPERPSRIQTLCSAIMLIDMPKCRNILFDESYSKYFLDIDYGLRIWSSGYEVVCSPYSLVTHIGGATLQQGSPAANELFETQRQYFLRDWIESGRYRQLEEKAWQNIPEIQSFLDLSSEVGMLLNKPPDQDRERFNERALTLFRRVKNYPTLAQWVSERVWQALGSNPVRADDPEIGHLCFVLGCLPHSILIEPGFNDFDIVLYNSEFYAVPQTETDRFDSGRLARGEYDRYYRAESISVLKTRICHDAEEAVADAATLEEVKRQFLADTSRVQPKIVLVEEGFEGLNIVLSRDTYYAIPQGEGAFDLARLERGEYSRSYRANSIEELKAQIRTEPPTKFWQAVRNETLRAGSWRSAIKPVAKRVLKETVVRSIGAETLVRIKRGGR